MIQTLVFVSILSLVCGQDPSCETCSSQGVDTVCARDGMVYANECEARCQKTEVECKGTCPCDAASSCICGASYMPVCALSGKGYSNECEANCAKDVVVCDGDCPCPESSEGSIEFPAESQGGKICGLNYLPVCGEDGETYSNDCAAQQKGVFVKCEGECPCATNENCDYCCENVDAKQCTRIRPNCSGCPAN